MQCKNDKFYFVIPAQKSEIERINYLKMQLLRKKMEKAEGDSKGIVPLTDAITPNEASKTQPKGNTDEQTMALILRSNTQKELELFLVLGRLLKISTDFNDEQTK